MEQTKSFLFSEQVLHPRWEGSIPFQKSLELQEQLKPLAKKGMGFFLGFESRQGIITKGLRTEEEDILWSDKQLKKHKIGTVSLKRGGRVTLHTPGQLVIYPVIHLSSFKLKVKDFILLIENITKECLLDLGIATKRLEKDSGLSTPIGKIAFFGIHVSEGVSQHGLAINVSNDLNLFHSIKSCGVQNRPHDNLKNHNISLSTKELFTKWTDKATPIFNHRYQQQEIPESCQQNESELLNHQYTTNLTK